MEGKDLLPLVSALLGGIVVALFNHLAGGGKRRAEIAKLEAEARKAGLEAEKLGRELAHLRAEQAGQGEAIAALDRFKDEILEHLAAFSLSGHIYGHLQNIYFGRLLDEPRIYDRVTDAVRRELRFLIDHGLVEQVDPATLKDGDDIARKVALTPAGEWLVELREPLEGRPLPRWAQLSSERRKPATGTGT